MRSGPPATGLRKPESPKSAGNSAGKKGTAGGDCWEQCWEAALFGKVEKRHCSQQSPPAVPFFPALFPALSPALSPALLGDSGFLSPAAGGPDLKASVQGYC